MSQNIIRTSRTFNQALQEEANGELEGVPEAGAEQKGLRPSRIKGP